MRRFREGHEPRLSRAAFGEPYGLPDGTVLGLEDMGKRPRRAEVVNALAAAGICDHADWFLPAACPQCAMPADQRSECRAQDCALVPRRVA